MIGPTEEPGAPPALATRETRALHERARKFFARPGKARAQESFVFEDGPLADAGVRAALREAYAGKCAYCETPLGEEAMLVDRFRPASGALALDGTLSPDHYWWLAYTWENLYPSCPECQSFKGARFPVREPRAEPETTGEALRAERPLLLEPRYDDPEHHLVFAEDGSVASSTDEGRATIEILGLNRAQLLGLRQEALAEARREWESVSEATAKGGLDPVAFDSLFDRRLPFSALRRQFLNTWAHARQRELDQVLQATTQGPSSVAEVAGDLPVVTAAERKRVKGAYVQAQVAQDSYSLAGDQNASEDYFRRTRRIERIEVRNFKVIRELDLSPASLASTTATAPWLMLLGENGCGKSSLLQAVALTLMGAAERDALGLDASTYVSNGTRSGWVRVHLAGSPEPLELRFSRNRSAFTGGEEPKVILLAYGATRLLPRAGEQVPPPTSSWARVRNLFDPFSPIGNSTDWLLSLDDATFEEVARALKGLLDLETGDRLVRNRRGRRVDVEAFGLRVPLEHLSDGYQSVVALATDLMISLLRQWPSVEAAEGTVLIDELGAHLHPRWRMRIVPSLRQVFPRVQFLSSTHDPLCLRGLGDGEVVVVRRDQAGGVEAVTDLPSVAGLRVDQLLTSEHFGLNSTIDPELDALFAEYYLLKAKPHLTSAERRRRKELEARLDGLDVMGSTRRERIVLEAADDFLAKAGTLADPDERLALQRSTKRRIAKIWEQASAGKPVG
ncbi:MAG TPA: AAA family ATPase [Gaiella sp.]|nr:AAA family ATPase [Gaiella sp.]